MTQDLKKLIEHQISQELQRCISNLTYVVTNKVIDHLKSKHDTFVKIEDIQIKTDDDSLTKIEIVLRSL